MPDIFDDPVFQTNDPFNDPVFNKGKKEATDTVSYVAGQAAKGVSDIPGYIGDAIANPIRDLANTPAVVADIFRNLTGKETKAEVRARIQQALRPGVVSGPINKATDSVIGNAPAPNPTARYVGAGVRGAISMGPFAAEGGIPALIGGAGMGVGGEAGHDLFPDSPLAPIVGSLVGGLVGGAVPTDVTRVRTGMAIRNAAQNPDFGRAIKITMGSESSFNPDAVSPKGARGLMQVMPETAKQPGHGIRPSNGSPADDVRVGIQLFAVLLNKYDHDFSKAWGAYNWGEGRVDKAVSKYGENWFDHAPAKTQAYVAKNMSELTGGKLTGPAGPDGLPTNGSVPPIEASRLANIMQDQGMIDAFGKEPPTAANDSLSNSDLTTPEIEQIQRELGWRGHLTDIEQQEMDASAPKPVVDNTGYEAHTPYIEKPPEPANDTVASPIDAEIERQLNTPENIAGAKEVWDAAHEDFMSKFLQPDDYNSAMTRQKGGTGRKFTMSPDEFQAALDHADNEVQKYWQGKADIIKKNLDSTGQPEQIGNGGGTNGEPPDGGGEPPSGEPPQEPKDLDAFMAEQIDKAEPIRYDQEQAYSKERGKRLQEVAKRQAMLGGEQGYFGELSAMKGELPKQAFRGVRDQLEQPEIDELYNRIKANEILNPGEKLSAQEGLRKIIGESHFSTVPTKSEIAALKIVFPKLGEALESKGRDLRDVIADVANIPRSMMASVDLSAPLRQGIFLIGRKEFYTAFAKMIKQFVKEFNTDTNADAAFQRSMNKITSDPVYQKALDGGLSLTKTGKTLADREEQFMSSLAEKLPLGVGRLIRASDRAYIAFLNHLRFDTFKSIYNLGRETGVDIDRKFLTDLGKFINDATGRGDLDTLRPLISNKDAPFLAGFFFSPRLMMSRINLLTRAFNPNTYLKLHPLVRQAYLKSLFSFAAIALTTAGLAKLAGLHVDMKNPIDPDFMKIKDKNTRLDTMGGFQQYIRLAAQLITKKEMSSTTGKIKKLNTGEYDSDTRATVIGRFFRNKLSPMASLTVDWLSGSTATGEKFNIKNAAIERFVPMLWQDVHDVVKDMGARGLVYIAPDVFGASVQTYKAHPKKPKISTTEDPFNDPVFRGS